MSFARETLRAFLMRSSQVHVLRFSRGQEVQAGNKFRQPLGGDDSAEHLFGRVVDLLTQVVNGDVSAWDSAQ